MNFVFNDGGRAAAGFKGSTRDCVTRAIAIATGKPYAEIYAEINRFAGERGDGRSSARTGVWRKTYGAYLEGLGWRWVACMSIGSGCQVHLRADELPGGTIIARLSRHVCCVIDGVIHDAFDPSRGGTRCVYGYYIKPD